MLKTNLRKDLRRHSQAGRILQEPGSPRRPFDENSIEWVQLKALVRLYLQQGFRAAPGGEKKAPNPLKQVVTSMCFMGIVFALNARLCSDPGTFLILLFTSNFLTVALAIMPDTYELRQRNLELLHSKPISNRTHAAASTVVLFCYASIIASCMSLAPFVALKIVFDVPISVVVGTFLILNIGVFSIVVLWLLFVVLAASVLSVDRMRAFAQFMLVIAYLGTLIGSGALYFSTDRTGPLLSLTDDSLVRVLPSTWFATFLTGGLDDAANLQRAGAILVTAVAMFVAFKLDLRKSYPQLIEKLGQQTDRPARQPLSVKAMKAIRLLPGIGHRLISDQTFATATIALTTSQREEASRLKTIGPTALLLATFVAVIIWGDHSVPALLVTFYGFMLVVDGLNTLKTSSHSSASWIFNTVPLKPHELLKAVRLAILLRFFSLAGILGTVSMFITHPPAVAAVLSAAYLAQAAFLVTLNILVQPAIPLSQETVRASNVSGFGITTVVQFVSAAGYFLITTLVGFFGNIALVAGVVGLVFLMLINHFCAKWAGSRLSELEYT